LHKSFFVDYNVTNNREERAEEAAVALNYFENHDMENGPILDIGCGNGSTTQWFSKNLNTDVVGIEVGRTLPLSSNTHNPRINLLFASGLKLPFLDKSFNFRSLNKTQLLKLKTKAMRSGAWFKALQRIDRVLFDLTIKVATNVRSTTLAKSLLSITGKLQNLFVSKLSQTINGVGFPLALKISELAQKWGNNSAREWADDLGVARYLALMKLNWRQFNGGC
jgi:hypothetical protein